MQKRKKVQRELEKQVHHSSSGSSDDASNSNSDSGSDLEGGERRKVRHLELVKEQCVCLRGSASVPTKAIYNEERNGIRML